MLKHQQPPKITRFIKGFTLLELIVTIAIAAILSAVALPNLGSFLAGMRVDGQISEMHRLLLTARNTAINSGRNTTVCPLDAGNRCTNDWTGEISVFTNNSNTNGNDVYTPGNPGDPAAEQLIIVKSALSNSDSLQTTENRVVYSSDGTMVFPGAALAFSYCPVTQLDESRGIDITANGRPAQSTYDSTRGVDVDRANNPIVCR